MAEKSRNRSAEALKAGRKLIAVEITPETDARIDAAREHLRTERGPASRVVALEWLVREGAKKIRKKIPENS